MGKKSLDIRIVKGRYSTPFEYLCKDCGQLRLSFAFTNRCANCGSARITKGAVGTLKRSMYNELEGQS